jgi:hypothetical protein
MKGVNYLIGVPNESIDGVNGVTEFFVKGADTQTKRGTIGFRNELTALKTRVII